MSVAVLSQAENLSVALLRVNHCQNPEPEPIRSIDDIGYRMKKRMNKLELELCQAQVWLKVGFRLSFFFVGDLK